MKKHPPTFPVALVLWGCLLPTIAFAEGIMGPRTNNGGGAWACRETSGAATRWIQLVDLFEAINVDHLQLRTEVAGEDAWTIYNARIDELKQASSVAAGLPLESASDLRQRLDLVASAADLDAIPDALLRAHPQPETCAGGVLEYVQLANFTAEGRLLVAQNQWTLPAFDVQEQAALLVHEAVYKALRDQFDDRNSVRAREIVGVLFADQLTNEQVSAKIAQTLATAPAVDDSTILVSCTAVVQRGTAAIATVPFAVFGSQNRVRLMVDDFEFLVDANGADGRPSFLQIKDWTKDNELFQKTDFGPPPAGAKDPLYQLAWPEDGSGRHVTLTCTRP